MWSHTLKCSVKSYVTGPSTKSYFKEFLFMWVFTHDIINKSMVMSVRSAMVSWFRVESVFKRWLENSGSDHETCSIWCDVVVHVDLPSILHSLLYSVGPSSVVWSLNLDRLRLFHQWECLKWKGHGLSVVCVKWPLELTSYTTQFARKKRNTSRVYYCTVDVGQKYLMVIRGKRSLALRENIFESLFRNLWVKFPRGIIMALNRS